MNRRGFLALVTAAAATAGGVLAVADRVRSEGLRQHLRRLEGFGRTPLERLRGHYAWLNADPAAFEAYVKNYQQYFGPLGRFSLPRSDFYPRFLLCTDFFARQAADPNGTAPVRYTGFYHPNQSPCFNPLAQPPPTDEELAAARAPRSGRQG
jgi:hypothetical protein